MSASFVKGFRFSDRNEMTSVTVPKGSIDLVVEILCRERVAQPFSLSEVGDFKSVRIIFARPIITPAKMAILGHQFDQVGAKGNMKF